MFQLNKENQLGPNTLAKPWRLGQYPLFIRSWKPNFAAKLEQNIKITAISVRISFLPIEYHNPLALISIGNLLGKTLALDGSGVSRASQVRLCIETELNHCLPSHIMVNSQKYDLIFENMLLFNSSSSLVPFGHRKQSYNTVLPNAINPKTTNSAQHNKNNDYSVQTLNPSSRSPYISQYQAKTSLSKLGLPPSNKLARIEQTSSTPNELALIETPRPSVATTSLTIQPPAGDAILGMACYTDLPPSPELGSYKHLFTLGQMSPSSNSTVPSLPKLSCPKTECLTKLDQPSEEDSHQILVDLTFGPPENSYSKEKANHDPTAKPSKNNRRTKGKVISKSQSIIPSCSRTTRSSHLLLSKTCNQQCCLP